MAMRDTAVSVEWHGFKGIDFVVSADGRASIEALHLPESILLDDQITRLPNGCFLLAGRNSDQINIAGKLGSLLEVNNILMKYSELIDGVVIFPSQDRAVPRLVALVVLSNIGARDDLRRHFEEYLDPAFVPRPILVVDSLPREENGKLIKAKVIDLYKKLTTQ